MPLKIGKDTFATKRPDDLDAQLLAATGCNAAETARHLRGKPIAGVVAAALRPFLGKDGPAVQDLASRIAADEDPDAIRRAVVALYAAAPEAAPAKGSANA